MEIILLKYPCIPSIIDQVLLGHILFCLSAQAACFLIRLGMLFSFLDFTMGNLMNEIKFHFPPFLLSCLLVDHHLFLDFLFVSSFPRLPTSWNIKTHNRKTLLCLLKIATTQIQVYTRYFQPGQRPESTHRIFWLFTYLTLLGNYLCYNLYNSILIPTIFGSLRFPQLQLQPFRLV